VESAPFDRQLLASQLCELKREAHEKIEQIRPRAAYSRRRDRI